MQGEAIELNDIVERLAERVKNNEQTILVLGARSGAFFRNKEFYKTLELFGESSFANFSHTKQFGLCYGILKNIFSVSETDQFLKSLLKDETFTEATMLLAALIKLNLFSTVISTNVDESLEQALEYVGMEKGRDFSIYDYEEITNDASVRSTSRGHCRVFKANGLLDTGDYNINWNEYIRDKRDFENLLTQELRQNVMAIGLDPVWDRDFCQMFHLQGDSIWHISEDPFDENADLYEIIKDRNVRHFLGEEGAYEDFIKALYWLYTQTMSPGFVLHGVILHEVRQLRNEIIRLREEIRLVTEDRHES